MVRSYCSGTSKKSKKKNSLIEEAIPYKRNSTVAAVFDNLRTRFGMTIKEAKNKLCNLQQQTLTFHQLGDVITKLIDIIYGQGGGLEKLELETFKKTITSDEVRKFLHIQQPATLQFAIKKAMEFYLLEHTKKKSHPAVTFVEKNSDRRLQALMTEMSTLKIARESI